MYDADDKELTSWLHSGTVKYYDSAEGDLISLNGTRRRAWCQVWLLHDVRKSQNELANIIKTNARVPVRYVISTRWRTRNLVCCIQQRKLCAKAREDPSQGTVESIKTSAEKFADKEVLLQRQTNADNLTALAGERRRALKERPQ